MPRFLAHFSEDGREQTVEEHLLSVLSICGRFAKAFFSEEQGRLIGLAHDIGKCSDEFQARLRGGKIVDHASAGALECAKMDSGWAACCIAGHHGGLPDVGNPVYDIPGDHTLCGRLKKALAGEIPAYTIPIPLHPVPAPPGYGNDGLTDSFIIRMLYSCLVDADYLDTEQFMSGHARSVSNTDSIAKLLERLDRYTLPWQNPKTELNRLRCDILASCAGGGKAEKGIFSLTVPTGGGKTVASMAFALNHAIANQMDRIIYVIPYTSIIEQTAEVFRGIFGDQNVLEHHSSAGYDVSEGGDAGQYLHIKATENWDIPIVVTTAVQFFESLYANRPSKCRKLHSIANSVIIFDEAQMLPTEHLRPCVAAIAKLVDNFGATAVLCTATQPFLNDLVTQYAPGISIRELCPGAHTMFSKFRRVTFRNSGKLDTDSLADRLAENLQVLCIVNSRKAAQDVYRELPGEGRYHLSTLMYPAHRRAVLAEIRSRLAEGLPCRVVSTSLIEAGVDVDFPAVYREMAGLDSILQAAGRCNREGKRPAEESFVTIFSGVSATPQMLRVNIGAAREVLRDGADPAAPDTVARYFRVYRSMAGSSLDKTGIVSAFENGIAGCGTPFRTAAEKFRLIDDLTKTVYVPLGEGYDLVRRLENGERSRDLFRKLGSYAVSVYGNHYDALMTAGFLSVVDEDSAILQDSERYDPFLGLCLCDNTQRDLFI